MKLNLEHQLAKLIWQDICRHKLTLTLVVMNLISALAIVNWVQLNRQMVIQQDVLFQQRDDIDLHWRRLLLEQRVLAEHSRIEQIARNKLSMIRPTTDLEVVVQLP